MNDTYFLEPQYDTRKSFYKKARIEVSETTGEHGKTILKDLYSYDTLVGKILYSDIDNKKQTKYLYMGKYSQTTTRHQKEFFKQEGLSDKKIKELFKNGVLVYEQ